MKRLIYILIIAAAFTAACNEKNGPDIIDVSPFGVQETSFYFRGGADTLEVADGMGIISIYNEAEWLSANVTENGELCIETDENKTIYHRSDTLTVVFDTRQAYRLAISQNAYPHITVTLNDDPFYTIENDTLYVGVAVEIGEDVADMRLAVICDYNMDIPGFKDYFINCSPIFDGKVFTMENYLKERDEYGVFYLTMSSRYFDIPNLCIAYMALDETGEYSFNYVMLSEAGD